LSLVFASPAPSARRVCARGELRLAKLVDALRLTGLWKSGYRATPIYDAAESSQDRPADEERINRARRTRAASDGNQVVRIASVSDRAGRARHADGVPERRNISGV
jgi:hypothetical protein